MLKSSLLFKKIQTSGVNNSNKNAEFSEYFFIGSQTYREVFKSALVYL